MMKERVPGLSTLTLSPRPTCSGLASQNTAKACLVGQGFAAIRGNVY